MRCVDLDWRTLSHELLAKVPQAQFGAVIQQTREVSMTRLDVDQQKNMRVEMARETQSWLKTHAVEAALRSQFAATDVIKERGHAKSRQAIIGYHDLVRTGTPVISWRGRSPCFNKVAQNRFKLRKENRQKRVLPGRKHWSRRGAGG